MDDIVKKLLKEQSALESKRKVIEEIWQHIYEMVDPANAFITKTYSASELWTDKLYSTTAMRCLPKFVAALQSTVTPPNQRWHRLAPPTIELRDDKECKEWLNKLCNVLFDMRYRPSAGFNKAMIKIWNYYAKVGHGIMFCDEVNGAGTSYQCIHIKDFCGVFDSKGLLKKCFCNKKFAFWELCEWLEEKGKDPKKVLPRDVLKRGELDSLAEFELSHVVVRLGQKEREEKSVVIATGGNKKTKVVYRYWGYLIIKNCDKPQIVHEQGFFTCPYMFTRYKALENDIYSSSPSLESLPDAKMLNRMRKSIIEGAEKAVDPIVLARADAGLGGITMHAGAMIAGGMSNDGKPMMATLDTSGNIGVGVDMETIISKGIEDSYLVPLFQIFMQKNNMTATEVNELAFERAMLMSINAFPVENELLDNMIHRELDIAWRQCKFPPNMPKKLQELMERGEQIYSIQYEGEAHKAQELMEGTGIMQTVQAASVLAGFDPKMQKVFKTYDILLKLAGINNMPIELVKDKKAYEEIKIITPEQPVPTTAEGSAGNVASDLSSRLMAMRG